MISPGGIPQFTGDFDELDRDVSALRSDAIGIRNGGADVHARFQMLEAFYTAPEAEALFATTQPVMDTADEFAAKLETVADALDTFSVEARPLAERLKQLKADAVAFTDSVEGDDDWTEDEKKVDRNKQLVDDVSATQFAFQDAERRAASRISAVVGGPAFVADDGSGLVKRGTVTYGYDADLFEGAKELPWGSVDDKTYDPWSLDWFGHGAKSVFWDGIYKDGIEAGAKGLWALATGDGEAWSGLKDVVTGIGLYTMTPYDAFMDWAVGPDEESEDEVRAKKAAKEFAKGIVAWDQWEENPARATGTVIFNVLTLGAGPLAAASRAGKGGLASNAAGAASKAGLYMDPLYVGLKATGAAAGKLPKLSDLTSRITAGAGAAADAQRVHSVIELEDGSRVVIENGEFIVTKDGRVVTHTPSRERSVSSEAIVVREREFAGATATARTSAATSRAGDELVAPAERGGPGATGSAHEGRAAADASRAGAAHGAHSGSGADVGGPGRAAGQLPPQRGGGSAGGGHDGQGSGGRNALEREREIMRQQVERANNDPGWFKEHYRSNGYRRSASAHSEYGRPVPQIVSDPFHPGQWIAKSDMPPAIKERYLHTKPITGSRSVVDADSLRHLDEQAAKRDASIAADKAAARKLTAAEKAYAANRTQELADAMHRADAEHSPLHGDANRQSELFGEQIAEQRAVPENYPDPVRVDDGAFGNNRFDQIYRTSDGRYVVVEAKGSLKAQLGVRKGHSGRLVTQGTREYFETILLEMEKRATRNRKKGLIEQAKAEKALAQDLMAALDAKKLEYVLVKADADGARYAGYEMKKFDITK